MQKKVKAYPPTVPNFLQVEIDGNKSPAAISFFTEEELREIGKEWTEKLIEHAKKRKNEHCNNIVNPCRT